MRLPAPTSIRAFGGAVPAGAAGGGLGDEDGVHRAHGSPFGGSGRRRAPLRSLRWAALLGQQFQHALDALAQQDQGRRRSRHLVRGRFEKGTLPSVPARDRESPCDRPVPTQAANSCCTREFTRGRMSAEAKIITAAERADLPEVLLAVGMRGWSVSEPERDLHTPFKKTEYKYPLLIRSEFVHTAFLRPEGGVACPGEDRRPAAGPCAGARAGPHGPDRTALGRRADGSGRGADGRVVGFNPCLDEVAGRRNAADRSCDPAGPGSSRVRGHAAATVPIVLSHSRSPGVGAPVRTGRRRQSAPRGGKGTKSEESRNVWNSHGTQPELSVNVPA